MDGEKQCLKIAVSGKTGGAEGKMLKLFAVVI